CGGGAAWGTVVPVRCATSANPPTVARAMASVRQRVRERRERNELLTRHRRIGVRKASPRSGDPRLVLSDETGGLQVSAQSLLALDRFEGGLGVGVPGAGAAVTPGRPVGE